MYKKIALLINKRIKLQLIILLFFSFFVALLELLSLSSLPLFVDVLFNSEKIMNNYFDLEIIDNFNFGIKKKELLIYFSIGIFLLFFIKNIIIILYIFFEKLIVYKIRVFNSKKLYDTIINDEYSAHTQKDISRVNRNFLYDIDGACSVIEHSMIIIRELLVLIALIILLSYQDVIVFLGLLFLFIICGSLYYFFLRGRIVKYSKRALENRKEKISFLNQSFRNFVMIRIYSLGEIFKKKYVFFLKDTEKFKVFVNIITSITKPLFETLAFLTLSIVIIYSFMLGAKEENLLSLLTLLVVVAYRLMPLIYNLTNSFAKIKSKQVVLEEISNDILKFNELNKKIINKDIITFNKLIKLENINYNYSGGSLSILRNFNLEIQRGQKLFIHGATGSGKSTLLNIISGLIIPDSGKIIIDGVNLKNNLSAWQQNISFVEQKTFLFKDNIKNNITMLEDKNKFNQKKFNNILKICFLEEIYSQRQNEILDEDGIKISGGEKQRIGLARALYKNRDLLILDEATNAINTDLEKNILNNILTNFKDKTIICISHNLDSKNIFDKVVNIDKLN